jgi:putative hemolysin
MEAITGEFKPRTVEEAWAIRREDGSWLLDGLIPVPELKDKLALKSVPEEDRGSYHTLAGMLMLQLGRLPQEGDSVDWENWRLEVVDMDGRRIDKVLAMPRPPSRSDESDDG